MCPEEVVRDRRAVWVVLMAYGWGLGLRDRSWLLDGPKGRGEAEPRAADSLMGENALKFLSKYL